MDLRNTSLGTTDKMKSLIILCAVSAVHACLREHALHREFSHYDLLTKRQTTDFPPTLTSEEAVLVSSFNNVTISQWSYYYTHGLHLAGTNQSMAQWTADRWSENGFVAGLAPYCRLYKSVSVL